MPTLEDLRIEARLSVSALSREAKVDMKTVKRAIDFHKFESKTEGKTISHKAIRLNNNRQKQYVTMLDRLTEAVLKPIQNRYIGSSNPLTPTQQ